MKIAINTKFLADKNKEGFARFIYEVSRRLVQNHPEDQFYFLFDRKYDPDLIFGTNVEPIVVHPQARHPFLWYIWYQWTSRRVLKRIKPDVYLSPDGITTTGIDLPKVTVIHDIGFEKMDNQVPKLVQKYWRKFTPISINHSDKIITVSEFSKEEIKNSYPAAKGKTEVVYNGYTSNFRPVSKEEASKVRNEFSSGQPYLLYVGSIHPRKNVLGLIKAFERFKQQTDNSVKLVLAGRWAWQSESTKEYLDNSAFSSEIITTGYISEEKLSALMSSALVFCYVSFYEGFGIPILEAMSAGVPVMTSKISSMPEIAGNAALKLDPYNIEEIAQGIERLVSDDALRESLINAGFERVKFFSWDKAAEEIYQILVSVAD